MTQYWICNHVEDCPDPRYCPHATIHEDDKSEVGYCHDEMMCRGCVTPSKCIPIKDIGQVAVLRMICGKEVLGEYEGDLT